MFTESIPNQLSSKSPFGYYYDLKNIITNQSITNQNVNLSMTVPISGVTTTFTVLDTTDPTLLKIVDKFRPIAVWAIWIMTAFVIYQLITVQKL